MANLNGLPSYVQTIDQEKLTDKSTQKLGTRIAYTEPLSKKYSLIISYELSYNKSMNNQITHTYSPLTQKYDVAVDSLTNDFTQKVWVNKPSLQISFSDKKLKFTFGSGFGLTHYDLEDRTLGNNYKRNFTNFFPSANINYTYKNQKNLRFNYNGYTNQPSLNQLQPLRNNNDFFNQYIGNPDLKPSFSHNFNVSHNAYNFIKDQFMYQSLNFRFTSNAITNSRTVNLDSGKTVTKPINTNGNFGVSLWTGLGAKIKLINTRYHFGPFFRYNQAVDVYNNASNKSKTWGTGVGLNLNKSKEKKYDLGLNNDFSYEHNTNSQSGTSLHYFTNTIFLTATYYFTKSWSLNSNFNYYVQQKTQQQGSDLSRKLWNARMEKTFKKDEFTAYLSVNDILNQNVGINRSFDRNTFSEIQNDRLKRYWMIGFSWNFKNKGSAPSN